MGKSQENLKIRLRESIKIYRDSPALTVTYADLARITENLLEVINNNCEEIGFKNGSSITNS